MSTETKCHEEVNEAKCLYSMFEDMHWELFLRTEELIILHNKFLADGSVPSDTLYDVLQECHEAMSALMSAFSHNEKEIEDDPELASYVDEIMEGLPHRQDIIDHYDSCFGPAIE